MAREENFGLIAEVLLKAGVSLPISFFMFSVATARHSVGRRNILFNKLFLHARLLMKAIQDPANEHKCEKACSAVLFCFNPVQA